MVAGNLPPDHDPRANFRQSLLAALPGLVVAILLVARWAGVRPLGRMSFEGTTIHAAAAQSTAVRYQRRLASEQPVQTAVAEVFALGEWAEQAELPDGLVVDPAIAWRHARLERRVAACS
ncbi:MAG: hypothetical protein FJX77_15800 [Armatimonadetes bacterium]|nr:hypothetical protein [Armatimonadota bacterium]